MKKLNLHKLDFGQDLVEFALILPILLMMVLMIFDLGRVVYYYSALMNVAREGARTGILYDSDTSDIQAAVCLLSIGLDIGCPNPAIVVQKLNLESDTGNFDDHIRVQVTYQFKPVTPIVQAFLNLGGSDTISLNSYATMRLEY